MTERPGEARVRSEFLVKRTADELSATAPTTATAITVAADEAATTATEATATDVPLASAVTEGEQQQQPAKKKVKGGMNKNRPHTKTEHGAVCNRLAATGTCEFGSSCKFSHDLTGYLTERPTDLGPTCVLFAKYGHCRFGINCRYGASHIDPATGLNLRAATAAAATTAAADDGNSNEANVISRDVQTALRKRQFDSKRVDTVVQRIQQAIALVHQDSEHNTARMLGPATSTAKGNVPLPAAKEEEATATTATETTIAEDADAEDACEEGDTECGATTDRMATDDVPADPTPVAAVAPTVTAGMVSGSSVTASLPTTSLASELTGSKVRLVIPPPPPRHADDATEFFQELKLRREEKKKVDFYRKLYVAPLTTVGNLPFRRMCKKFGADITCGEMALCQPLLLGQQSEWSLLRRHESEDVFGVQLCASNAEFVARTCQVIEENFAVDFVDLNCGCPIDLVCRKGAGSALADKARRFEAIVRSMDATLSCPVTVKMRMGRDDHSLNALKLFPQVASWGASALTLHGRTRVQRYSRLADWDYIGQCVRAVPEVPVLGNGDIFNFEDYERCVSQSGATTTMIGRGALIKPWLFTEIKEQRHWDISSRERLDLLRDFVNAGLEHWGSDQQGVNTTRRFLLEWMSFLYRYIPYGLLEVPARINDRPPRFFGRDDLETLMASDSVSDWIKISTMLLGPPPDNFVFVPKHKSNAYSNG